MSKNITILPIFLLLLCSCVSTYGGGSENTVKVYTSTFSTSQTSLAEAQKHCAQYNKQAELVRSSYFPSYDEYSCVTK